MGVRLLTFGGILLIFGGRIIIYILYMMNSYLILPVHDKLMIRCQGLNFLTPFFNSRWFIESSDYNNFGDDDYDNDHVSLLSRL